MPVGATFYTELIASTREAIVTSELVDNVLRQHPLLELFASKAVSKTGRKLLVNIEGAELGGTAWSSDGSGQFSIAVDSDIVGTAEYAWSMPLVSKTRLKYTDIEMNAGQEAIVDLVRTHMKAAEKDHRKTLAAALYAAVPAAGAPLSLPVIINSGNVVGGIDGAVKSYWNAVERTSSAAAEGIKAAFRGLVNDIFVGSDGARPTHILCGINVYEEYEASLDDASRAMMTANPSTIDGRFRELKFDGLAVRLDPDCPADEAFFLNADDLVFAYLGDNWMKVGEQQQIQGYLDTVTPITSIVAFGASQRRSHGHLVRTA